MVRLRMAAWLLVGVVSCASPTLPLPPPEAPSQGQVVNGRVHLSSPSGSVEANAIIVIVNRNPSLPGDQRVSGSQADATGAWDADVTATHGDVLDITQEFASTRSPPLTIQIR